MNLHTVALALIVAALLVAGCDKKGSVSFPDTPPDKVVMTFFGLLAEGGKLTNKEALTMISERNGSISPDNFRRWTENYSKDTKIEITKTTLPASPDDHGDWIARVEMQVKTPSIFGGEYATTSAMHLILDEKLKQWKIDFLAETLEEDSYRTLPAEARAQP
ncbi:MAG: hypothetical protein HQK87_03140 [Nitrospinae bacterium]|nr:hypothetical protein [Nitrospinota bacterium]